MCIRDRERTLGALESTGELQRAPESSGEHPESSEEHPESSGEHPKSPREHPELRRAPGSTRRAFRELRRVRQQRIAPWRWRSEREGR
eukprot:13433597-Alexandrium_andersonii.AAC.1